MTTTTIRYLRSVLLFLTVLMFGYTGQAQTLGSLHSLETGSKQLTIDQGASLKSALLEVEHNYNVGILYKSDIVEGLFIDQAATLPLNVEEALSFLLRETGLRFKPLNPKTYGIYREVNTINRSVDALLQQSISGTVTSADDGEPLPGVNITVPDTNLGTTTDMDGNYSITVPDTVNVLVFSFIGFQTQRIEINGRTQIDVAMQTQVYEAGEELVVVGYGTQQKSDVTGAVSTVSMDKVKKVPTANVQDALQGQVAGVQITPQSGAPGAQADIRIRGVGTLNNASPIYVVDGLILDDISFLNSNDIESIQVLKDASATAIYGVRGANGVIIITTNQGVQGDTQFEFSSYAGIQQVQNKIDVTNAREYATLANELAENEGFDPLFDNPNQFGEGTDWQDVVFDPGAIHNYQLRASGGNENLTFSVSGNYFNQQGVVRGSDYERLTLRLNNTYNIAENVNFGHNVALIYFDRTDAAGGIVGAAYRTDPTIEPFNDQGEFSDASARSSSGNPEASIFYNNNDNYGYRTVGDAYFSVNFLNNFEFRSSFGLDLERNHNKDFVPEFEVSPTQRNEDSRISVGADFRTNWLWENTLTYQQDFQDHSVTLLGGITAQEQKFENLGGSRINVPGSDDNLWYLTAGQEEGQTNFNSANETSYYSYLFRANYQYKNRYLFTGSYRIDGSSRFAEDNRWGYFPSVALGWIASQESFMENIEAISYLKFRGSYGVIGNDKIGAYPTFVTVTSNQLAVFGPDQSLNNGATITQIVNRDQIWEETKQLDIGFELNLFDNRLQSEIDYYRRDTEGILVPVPIPFYTGVFNEPVVNAAEVRNDGFDINLSWREARGDWSYNIGIVASTVNNEVLALGQGNEEILAGGLINEIGATTRTVVGSEIGAFWGYEAIGVFQTEEEIANSPTRGAEEPGDLIYKDQNDDGVINTDDRVEIGSPIADWTFGLNLGFNFKGFDMSMSFDGQAGHDIFNAKKAVRFGVENFESSALDRWTGPGTSNSEPRITNAGHNYLPSTYFLEDGDFLRLRNLQVGYTLPVSLTNQIGVRNIRLYANATNLFTITDYSGYTPQIGGGSVLATSIDRFGGIYPVSSVYTGGIEVSF